MKKSTLLSLLTTAAIITTTAGTYATWDILTIDTSSKVTFTKPVTITNKDGGLNLRVDKRNLSSDNPTASGTASFTVNNFDNLVDQLTITPTISVNSAKSKPEVTSSDFTIEVTRTDAQKLDSGNNNSVIDKSISSENNYNVKVTALTDKFAGEEITVSLTAELSKQPTSSSPEESH